MEYVKIPAASFSPSCIGLWHLGDRRAGCGVELTRSARKILGRRACETSRRIRAVTSVVLGNPARVHPTPAAGERDR